MGGTAILEAGAELFPGCKLTRFLGRGAWGEVWKAERANGTSLALKFLPCDSQLTAAQEIRALQSIRQLRHPHLIRIEQISCCAGHIAIAMELADGSLLDLQDIYHSEFGTPIHPQHLCHYLAQAASALDFLNTRQHLVNGSRIAVRHCDVKPSNLLVLAGKIKLADFGLAAQTTAPIGYHRRVGTLDYTAPEVFQGWLSDRTDQYALAVTYCELRGRLPFRDTPATFRKDYLRPAPDLLMLTPAEQPIIARALNPTPQNRWPSCTEMMTRLTSVVRSP